MTQCKLSGCREPAVPGGKRYCAEHLARYKERRDADHKRRQSLPDCVLRLTNECEGKVGPRRAEAGETTCLMCARELERQNALCDFDSFMELPEAQRWRRVFDALGNQL